MRDTPLPSKAARRLAELAPEVVLRIRQAVDQGSPADAALAALFREHREYGARDRRFLADMLFSYFRWKGWTDAAHAGLEASCAVSYCLDATAPHPAAILLAQKAGVPAEPSGRLPLQEKAEAAARWLGRSQPFDVQALVPPWLKNVVFDPTGKLIPSIESFQQRPPTWLRLSGGHEQTVPDALRGLDIPFTRHGRIPSAVAISGASGLAALPKEVKAGFEIQDLASQCVGLVCNPKAGERWLDMCAGAGGKSLHLADLMSNRGYILAADIRKPALDELRRRARRTGAVCIQPTPVSPPKEGNGRESPPPEGWRSRGGFDGVLVDAPCTGIGTWSRNPDARWRTREEDVAEKAALQGDLLEKAARNMKPGGVLVYSVCTITTAETVAVVERFLRQHSEFRLAPVPHPLTGALTDGTLWVWPWDGPCDGMFIARMRLA